jgi:hypothetical protein
MLKNNETKEAVAYLSLLFSSPHGGTNENLQSIVRISDPCWYSRLSNFVVDGLGTKHVK